MVPVVAARAIAAARSAFNGVKVFSATMSRFRDVLGERVTEWIAANPRARIVDVVVTQSSDAEFHCVAITLFYDEPLASSAPGA